MIYLMELDLGAQFVRNMTKTLTNAPCKKAQERKVENENNPKCHKPETEKSHQGGCTAKILVFCAPVPSRIMEKERSGFITLPGNEGEHRKASTLKNCAPSPW